MSETKRLQDESASLIIKNHMLWSMGAGFIPIPIADFFAVGYLQLDMIRQLSKIYDIDFQETEGKAIIASITTAGLAKVGAARAIKFIPVVGTFLGGIALSIFPVLQLMQLVMHLKNISKLVVLSLILI